MANRKFSPFPVLKQEKQHVHEVLYRLSLDFQSIAAHLQLLNDKAIPRETVKLFRMQAEAMSSGIAHLLTGVLHRREAIDWHHFWPASDCHRRTPEPGQETAQVIGMHIGGSARI